LRRTRSRESEKVTYGTLVPLPQIDVRPSFRKVKKWNANPSTLFILGGLLVIIFLILVLPQVDLLDTAFHRGSSPVALKARFTSAPVFAVVAAVTHRDGDLSLHSNDQLFLPDTDSGEGVSSLLCIFRC
jgi:hypothetical protein